MPPRVAATFGAADFIAAEDTRVTMKLLNFLGLKKPMVSYYEHALQKGEGILRRICLLYTSMVSCWPVTSRPSRPPVKASGTVNSTMKAVSYTHLDVYKRQLFRTSKQNEYFRTAPLPPDAPAKHTAMPRRTGSPP